MIKHGGKAPDDTLGSINVSALECKREHCIVIHEDIAHLRRQQSDSRSGV